MAWDFETEPEFEAKLQWMREFIDREIVPARADPGRDLAGGLAAGQAPPPGAGEGAGAVGRVPRSRARRARLRTAEAGADVGDHRALHDLDDDLRRSGARQREHGAARPRRQRGAEAALAVAEPARRHHFARSPSPSPSTPAPTRRRSARRRQRDGDEWVINGHKWFITNASSADIILVFAETNPEGRPHKHASIFIVPTGTPGLEIVRDIGTMSPSEQRVRPPGQPRRADLP